MSASVESINGTITTAFISTALFNFTFKPTFDTNAPAIAQCEIAFESYIAFSSFNISDSDVLKERSVNPVEVCDNEILA